MSRGGALPAPLFLGPVLTAAFVGALLPQAVRGEEPVRSKVAVIAPQAAEGRIAEIATRVIAELRAAGFDVRIVQPSGGGARAEVESAAREAGAFAAVAIEQIDEAAVVDVWWADAVTGKTLVRRFDPPAADPAASPSVLAVRAVELLRASLIEGLLPAAPAPGEAGPPDADRRPPPDVDAWMEPTVRSLVPPGAAPDPAPPPAPPDRRRFRLGLGAGGAVSWARGAGVGGGPTARLFFSSPSGWGAHASLQGPSFGHVVSRGAARAEIRQEVVSAEAGYSFRVLEGRLEIETRLGLGAHHLRADGQAPEDRETRSDEAWALSATAGVAAVLWLGDHIALDVGATALVTLPPIEVRFAGEEVAGLNAPAISGTMGARAAL